MTISQFITKLTNYTSIGLGKSFTDAADVSWNDYYDLKEELEKHTGKFINGAFKITNLYIHKSKTVPDGCVWPCNCAHDSEYKEETVSAHH